MADFFVVENFKIENNAAPFYCCAMNDGRKASHWKKMQQGNSPERMLK